MIALEAVQLRRLADELVRQLQVDDMVRVIDVLDLSDAWSVEFEDRWPDTRFPAFALEVQRDWSREHAATELRLALREKLWICPLCQRRARIRRVVDMDVFRIDCEQCGRFEIEHELLDHFRAAFERGDEELLAMLPRLSGYTRTAVGIPSLGMDTWRALAGVRS
jgi:hypothetical protein